jgi:hypothetical protein
MDHSWLTTSPAARFSEKSSDTLRAWHRDGRIAVLTTTTGTRLFATRDQRQARWRGAMNKLQNNSPPPSMVNRCSLVEPPWSRLIPNGF